MSMYSHLLEAALAKGSPTEDVATRSVAVDGARRRRRALDRGVSLGTDSEAVPAALALQLDYDLALFELARVVGISTDPSRFDRPEHERARLQQALGELGISLEVTAGTEEIHAERL